MWIHKITPPHLTHPGWHLLNTHAHAQGHTLMETDAIHWSGGQPFTAPGEHRSTVPCSRAPWPGQGGGLPPLQLSVHQSLSSEIEPPTFRLLDDPLSPLSHGRPNGSWRLWLRKWAGCSSWEGSMVQGKQQCSESGSKWQSGQSQDEAEIKTLFTNCLTADIF